LYNAAYADSIIAIGHNAGSLNAYRDVILLGAGTSATQAGEIVLGNTGAATRLTARNYKLNVDQDTTGLDGQALRYNTSSGEIELRSNTLALDATDVDLTVTQAQAEGYENISIWMTLQSGVPAETIEVNLPTPTAAMLGHRLSVTVEDADATYNAGLNTSSTGNEIWKQGSAISSETIADGETYELEVKYTGSTYYWVIMNVY